MSCDGEKGCTGNCDEMKVVARSSFQKNRRSMGVIEEYNTSIVHSTMTGCTIHLLRSCILLEDVHENFLQLVVLD